MASLKEIKNRIASVNSTLKITSAMKMVASAKLHKAQNDIEKMRRYEETLRQMLDELAGCASGRMKDYTEPHPDAPVLILAFSSNTSLCGSFNINVIRETRNRIAQFKGNGKQVEVLAVGAKMAEALKGDGCPSDTDYSALINHCSYESAASLAESIVNGYLEGRYGRVEFIFNHYISTVSQKVLCNTFLPMENISTIKEDDDAVEYIIEPSKDEMLDTMIPKVLRLTLYTVLLDSIAAEHAARTVAMNVASDNATDILQELTLEYNKERQQRITSEILDIVGGASE